MGIRSPSLAAHKLISYALIGQQRQPPPKLSDEEMEEFVKMFPNLDKEIILSVFEASRGNKEAMVNNLLQLGQQ